MTTAAVFGLVAAVVIGVVVFVVLRKERRARGWMSALAAEAGYDGSVSGVDPESGKPLREVRFDQCVEVPHRGQAVVAVEYRLGADRRRVASSVQIAAPAQWPFQLSVRTRSRDVSARFTKLEQVKTFDRDFDGRFLVRAPDRERAAELLTPELRARLLAEPRFLSWSVVAEDGRLYTRQEALLTRDELFAQADFLIDLLAVFPAEFWRATRDAR